ncbi:MAG: hypothetical protein LQ346_002645 [Caloplaca aetnensis]|nr:MAG: hypothetical protein LQ346_002645 [Caloplaca aetnensis]
MGKLPAVVIVARHGARLDAADKQWHLTSPTPYDPPLTYGGWVQSRTLGNRIGSILHAREIQNETTQPNGVSRKTIPQDVDGDVGYDGHGDPAFSKGQPRMRKHKVIIHSSPFLRCIQTSIAISAGISQFEGSVKPEAHHFPPKHHIMHSEAQHPTHPSSPYLEGGENWNVPHLSAIPEPAEGTADEVSKDESQLKACLRLDAFLGEWLSPEYFDFITPPPSSVMMLTSAKADLMRGGEYIDVPAGSFKNAPDKGNFPGGWGSNMQSTRDATSRQESGPLSSISTISASLPRIQRASSHSNVKMSTLGNANLTSPKSVSKIETSALPGPTGYEPPTPSYAISPSDPIPPGYVAHARDACVDVDFRWDSMRPPHDWGHGGDYGEEWSAMHKRFRRGLQSMVTWYQHNHTSLTTQDVIDGSGNDEDSTEKVDDTTDVVLILVTHGAGCNALIGALTNQPVLLDVGMASLTMAVRKDRNDRPQSSVSPKRSSRRRSTLDTSLSDDFDVKITASVDHLQPRSRSSTTGLSYRSPSLSSSPTPTHRHRTSSVASTASSTSFTDGDFKLDADNRAMTSIGIGGFQRNAATSGGLWSKAASKTLDGTSDWMLKEKALPISGHSPLSKEVPQENKPSDEDADHEEGLKESGEADGAPGQPTTQHGLWGAPPATTANEREKGFKRRWTHSENR